MLSTPLRFLAVLPRELSLATVLKSGQSFRWHRFEAVHATRPDSSSEEVRGEEWAFGWGDRTVCLRQGAHGIHYRSLFPLIHRPAYIEDLLSDTTLPLLRAYFQLDTPLAPLYAEWAARDPNFKKKVDKEGARLEGIRVLSQDPWENLVSFICSANNNIPRITMMVNKVCEHLGSPLPHPSSFSPSTVHTLDSLPPAATFPTPSNTTTSQSIHSAPASTSSTTTSPPLSLYAFPAPTSLTSTSTDALLRSLGFGYRAPFIAWTANYLLATSSSLKLTPDAYLDSLRHGTYQGPNGLAGVREKLLEFKGVGRKVADCVALFSLGWKEVVPVDTHVFQIAIRDYSFPASKSTALTPALHDRVCTRLQSLWGSHSGWCQQVLFFADLKTPTLASLSPTKKRTATATVVVKGKWEQEVEELMKTPGKRRRVTVAMSVTEKVKVEIGQDEDEATEQKV